MGVVTGVLVARTLPTTSSVPPRAQVSFPEPPLNVTSPATLPPAAELVSLMELGVDGSRSPLPTSIATLPVKFWPARSTTTLLSMLSRRNLTLRVTW